MRTFGRILLAGLSLLTLTGSDPKPPREIKLLIPEKTFKTEGPNKVLRVSFDDLNLLQVLNMDPVTADAPEHMPEWLKNLDGKRIRIGGYMYPPFETKRLKQFAYAVDEAVCTFGRQPEVYDIFRVDMKKGVTAEFEGLKPIDVEGVFHIEVVQLEGELVQLYYIDDAVIVPKKSGAKK
ncbi:MAG: hypothetical protein WEB58_13470 [Planctomycetaceae bacterium]